jgi:hypothetical protein
VLLRGKAMKGLEALSLLRRKESARSNLICLPNARLLLKFQTAPLLEIRELKADFSKSPV